MIVITTPTGMIGRQVLDSVIGRYEPIRVIARDPARLPPRIRERVDVVQGSSADSAVVIEALSGADCVFWVVPPNPRAESVPGHILDFVRPVCDAVTRHGVERVVGVSSLGRGIARKAGQISAIFALDDLIESTGVSYRSLSLPGFMENMLRQVEPIRSHGAFFLPVSGDRKLPACATRDIAAVAAELLLDGSWAGQESVPILGPGDLSYNDMAQIMTDVLRRPVRYQQVPGDVYKATLLRHGMSVAWAQGLVDMAAAVDDGIYDAQPRTSQSSTPTSFRQWCEDTLAPAVLA
jgi:uncharacterized protein YbjT (DUF2867 family)